MRQLKITKSITNRESLSLDKYLHEIGRFELISVEEEVELARKIRKGDKAAVERLTRSNLRFVVSVAKQYQNQGLSLPDLINEGNLGLIRAAHKFDETRGFKFISYAVWWIRQSIMQAINEQSRIIRLPLNQVTSFSKFQKISSRFEQEFERLPALEEISDLMEMPKDKLLDLIQSSGRHTSYDAPVSDDSDSSSLLDLLESRELPETDNVLIRESLTTEIERAFRVLNDRERTILRYIYGIGVAETSYEEVGEKLGLTRERVRQIKEKALANLRNSEKSFLLKTYLG